MRSFLTYWWHALRNPELKPFIEMGLGIAARNQRCQSFWAPHLACSKDFQMRILESRGKREGSCAILGPGRLLDVPYQSYQACFDKVDCFDADPGAAGEFSRKRLARPQDRYVVQELTGVISNWRRQILELAEQRGRFDLGQWIEQLDALEILIGRFKERYQMVVSINLLSQISIYWRDFVEDLWTDYFDTSDIPAELEEALLRTEARLQKAHLDQLRATQAPEVVLVTDRFALNYERDKSGWIEENLLAVDFPLQLKGYWLRASDTWLWHIVPQGIESSDSGVIHQVHGFYYVRD